MGYFSFILFLGATLVYINADIIYGNFGNNKPLVSRGRKLYNTTTVTFNTDHEYDLIINGIAVLFDQEDASCVLKLGGPYFHEMKLEIKPKEGLKDGFIIFIKVYGRWLRGGKTLSETDIKFIPKEDLHKEQVLPQGADKIEERFKI